ncbi:sigma-E factor negative regulatory protein [Bordetella sp. FB-8]|uniref:sigma-E factor negative regulatory protein n=1 Tax=Bordetella sp. FB-8 TaxID=1159870 RepID=UPI00036659B8|nr:sigma-E factor negative regulatory protein [Bordetella sp. FB-8]
MQSVASPPVPEDPRDDALYVQVSVWMDGEFEGDLPDILATPQGRQAWDTYHLIGDTLRSGDLALPAGAAFQARVLRALEAEPAIVAPAVPAGAASRRHRLRMALSGLAVAAAVATVAWMIQPYLGGSSSAGSPAVADATSAGQGNTATLDEASLHDYLEAHRQLAGPTAVRQVSFDIGTSH